MWQTIKQFFAGKQFITMEQHLRAIENLNYRFESIRDNLEMLRVDLKDTRVELHQLGNFCSRDTGGQCCKNDRCQQ